MIGRDYSGVGSSSSLIRQSDNASAEVVGGKCMVHYPRDDLLICCDSSTGAVFLYRQHNTDRLQINAAPTASSAGYTTGSDAAGAGAASRAGVHGAAESRFTPTCAVLSPHHGLLLCDQFQPVMLPFTAPDWRPAPPIRPQGSALQYCSHIAVTSFGHIIAADAINHRVVVLTAEGREFVRLGHLGEQRGEFREPCSVAWFAHNDRDETYAAMYRDPAWFTLNAARVAVMRELASEQLGAFRVRESGNEKEWDVLSLDFQGRIYTYKIREDSTGHYLAYSQQDDLLQEANPQPHVSLFNAIRKLPGITPPRDDRRHSIVAVADPGNDRIQLLWMYRVRSGVHQPELVSQALIGGKAGSTTSLLAPTAVAFTPKGDLVICDTGHKRVVVVSASLVVLHEFAFTLRWRNKVEATPVSASVSPSGNISVGFKRGGFAVFRGYKTNSAGDFEHLSLRCASLIMQSLGFADSKSLATTCTYFWKQLSVRRWQWAIAPLQSVRLTRAKFLFMKWAQTNLGTRPWKLVDQDGRPACSDFISRKCTRFRCPDSHNPPDLKSLIRKYDPVLPLENGLDLIVGQLYNLDFLHSMQHVIQSYFDSFASIQVVQERHELPRAAMRQTQETERKTLSFQHTFELLTMLEEHFTGCASIRTQPVFAHQVVIVPSSHSFGKFMMDPLEQYDPELGIPWTRSRNRQQMGNGRLTSALVPKKILPQGALSDTQRETHMLLHLQASERLSQSLSRMFK